MDIYRIEDLSFTYPKQEKPTLREVSLTLRRGEFVTLCGPSGCGKTTLLRQLKPTMSPHGIRSGQISFGGTALETLSPREQAEQIGFVQQCPENQVVTDKVWHELAFGLESLGLPKAEIRRRTAEMASFFGIQTWFYKDVAELSGGQKQLLNLASVMAMQPKVLILDEPTSQLDPIAASEFLATLGKLNRELGVTVILTEHRLEEAFPLSDRVVVMDSGRILADASPREAALQLRERGHSMFLAMPTAMRIWAAVSDGMAESSEVPVTVRDGANWLESVKERAVNPLPVLPPVAPPSPAVQWHEAWFKYEKNEPDVVKGLSFTAHYGEITAILGGNGTGKTTALSLAARLCVPYRGRVTVNGEDVSSHPRLFDGLLGVLPQNPQALFVEKTVGGDLLEMLSEMKLSKDEKQRRLAHISALCRLNNLLDSHPYDLSGGEQQRAALAKVLLLRPKILLLDEPTKGLDAEFKQVFAGILHRLTVEGAAVVLVSHDVEFCAEHADRCALFFDGGIVSEETPRRFFSGNSFYTTAANRMAREIIPAAVTAGEVVCVLGGREAVPPVVELEQDSAPAKEEAFSPHREPQKSISRKRLLWAIPPALLFLVAFVFAVLRLEELKTFVSGGGDMILLANPADAWRYCALLLTLALSLATLMLILTGGRENPAPRPVRQRLAKRTVAAAAMILLAIPLTIFVGMAVLDERRYYIISLLIILETMLPFALVFESRKPQARELVVIAVLCAIAVAGRAAFFMLPQFKPVAAVVIIAGVAFGGETGFLVGAMTGFVSNFFFGQGPYTPWQMFAFGILGFLAGVIFRRGLLGRSRLPLAVFGGFATFFIYGGIMNPAAVILAQPQPTWEMIVLAYIHGLPFDLIHAAATVTFVLLISQPMLEKLERVKTKFGLME